MSYHDIYKQVSRHKAVIIAVLIALVLAKSGYMDVITTIFLCVVFAGIGLAIEKATSLVQKRSTQQEYTQETMQDTPKGVEFYRIERPVPEAFESIVGLEKAKEAANDALGAVFTEKKDKLMRYNIKPPKGLLLYGPPGTGKTSFARAAATKFGCNFIVVNASGLIQPYVGHTEKNITNLFQYARKNAPSVIFFDEIDAVGKRRTGADMNTPSDIALNLILAGMDGFTGNEGVFIIAATNRDDILDPALTRPGRLDVKVEVGLPDFKSRCQLFDLYMMQRPAVLSVQDIEDIARSVEGLSPAAIKSACDRAAMVACKINSPITKDIIENVLQEN